MSVAVLRLLEECGEILFDISHRMEERDYLALQGHLKYAYDTEEAWEDYQPQSRYERRVKRKRRQANVREIRSLLASIKSFSQNLEMHVSTLYAFCDLFSYSDISEPDSR